MKPLEAGEKQPSGGRARRHKARSQSRHRNPTHWFAFALCTVTATLVQTKPSAAPAGELDGSQPRLTLTIRVYNYARVSAGKLRPAQNEARRIIGHAGVETVWLDCPTSRLVSLPAQGSGQQECTGDVAGATVILRVLNRSDYNSAMFNREVFGYTDGPALASVVYDRVAGLADADGDVNEAAVILGDVMAHEIGHLLLGSRTHSPTGIMQGRWDREQLRLALMGRQVFTARQAALMQARLLHMHPTDTRAPGLH